VKRFINNKSVFLFISLIFVLAVITACQADGHSDHQGTNDHALPQAPIEVTFSTEPESGVTVGEPVILVARVTQEGESVNDAELVRFEIWYDNEEEGNHHHQQEGTDNESHEHGHDHNAMEDYQTDHDMIEAAFREDGQYVLEYSFDKAGIYNVMYHVDARGYHAMTAHQVIVEDQE
jgi:hypothetical protein